MGLSRSEAVVRHSIERLFGLWQIPRLQSSCDEGRAAHTQAASAADLACSLCLRGRLPRALAAAGEYWLAQPRAPGS
ncbi:MAG: hypothetical protein CSA62_14530 [Planctomycetota bacterium]|nr:MAG: hypothetical protein CSA62_14530 [Planctomycetota bacterium]